MIRPLPVLTVLVLALNVAGASLAQPSGLRGPRPVETPSAAGTPAPPPVEPAPPAPPPASSVPSAQAVDQCRSGCAQTYYFCLAGDSPETCPETWGQCRLTCSAPPRTLFAPARR